MKDLRRSLLIFATASLLTAGCSPKTEETAVVEETAAPAALPSWVDGSSKSTIMDFVKKTTDPNSPDFVPEAERVAVFDNDGTLWSEQPYYFQLDYALYFIKKNASGHPEWAKNPTLKAAMDADLAGVLAGGEKGLMELIMVSHAGMTEEEFAQSVRDWLENAKHPKTGMPFNKMIYQPMVELLEYLRSNGYKTFIVSGGGIDFIRVWAEKAYGIPPYQVVGSSIKAKYEEVNGVKHVVKLPELNHYDDKAGKPVGIHQNIGIRPTIAVGNSDGDYEMIEYTTLGNGPRLGIYLHHTDSVREFAYDSLSHIGNLKKGLIDAPKLGWLVVDMKNDWTKVYPD